jgi:hypothetical protein
VADVPSGPSLDSPPTMRIEKNSVTLVMLTRLYRASIATNYAVISFVKYVALQENVKIVYSIA